MPQTVAAPSETGGKPETGTASIKPEAPKDQKAIGLGGALRRLLPRLSGRSAMATIATMPPDQIIASSPPEAVSPLSVSGEKMRFGILDKAGDFDPSIPANAEDAAAKKTAGEAELASAKLAVNGSPDNSLLKSSDSVEPRKPIVVSADGFTQQDSADIANLVDQKYKAGELAPNQTTASVPDVFQRAFAEGSLDPANKPAGSEASTTPLDTKPALPSDPSTEQTSTLKHLDAVTNGQDLAARREAILKQSEASPPPTPTVDTQGDTAQQESFLAKARGKIDKLTEVIQAKRSGWSEKRKTALEAQTAAYKKNAEYFDFFKKTAATARGEKPPQPGGINTLPLVESTPPVPGENNFTSRREADLNAWKGAGGATTTSGEAPPLVTDFSTSLNEVSALRQAAEAAADPAAKTTLEQGVADRADAAVATLLGANKGNQIDELARRSPDIAAALKRKKDKDAGVTPQAAQSAEATPSATTTETVVAAPTVPEVTPVAAPETSGATPTVTPEATAVQAVAQPGQAVEAVTAPPTQEAQPTASTEQQQPVSELRRAVQTMEAIAANPALGEAGQQIMRQAIEQVQQLDGASSVADVEAAADATDDPETKKKLNLLALLLKALAVMAVGVVASPVIGGVAVPVLAGAAVSNLGGHQ